MATLWRKWLTYQKFTDSLIPNHQHLVPTGSHWLLIWRKKLKNSRDLTLGQVICLQTISSCPGHQVSVSLGNTYFLGPGSTQASLREVPHRHQFDARRSSQQLQKKPRGLLIPNTLEIWAEVRGFGYGSKQFWKEIYDQVYFYNMTQGSWGC